MATFTREQHSEDRVCTVCGEPLPAGEFCYEPEPKSLKDKTDRKWAAEVGLELEGLTLCLRCFGAIVTGYRVRWNWVKRLAGPWVDSEPVGNSEQ